MEALLDWEAFCSMDGPTQPAFFVGAKRGGYGLSKMDEQVVGLRFEVQFKPGITNKAADAFSRHPQFMAIHFNAITASTCAVDWSALSDEIA